MNYTICEMDSFSVIGQEIELTNRQKENIKICVDFWRKFNNNLKKAYLSQSGNWIKYAFMERREFQCVEYIKQRDEFNCLVIGQVDDKVARFFRWNAL